MALVLIARLHAYGTLKMELTYIWYSMTSHVEIFVLPFNSQK